MWGLFLCPLEAVLADDQKFYPAYDTRTGRKLPHRVPAQWFDLFPYLAPTPSARVSYFSEES